MVRYNGSYLGLTVSPNSTNASGIWTVKEAETYLRQNQWPANPGVPGSPSGIAGDGQVSLTWTAPTLGPPPTGYLVQYSSDSGSTWTTVDPGSTSLSYTVTGLTNGTGYIFRIVAVNTLGQGPYGSASGAITPVASVAKASLLLHFDGANGSTSFTDSSANMLAMTAIGDAQISTAESKFGGASGYFDGSGDYITAATNDAFSFGTGDFTVECWLRFSSIPGDVTGFMQSSNVLYGAGTDIWWLGYASNWNAYSSSLLFSQHSSASNYVEAAWAPVANTWYHIAATRRAGVVYLYINGVQQETTSAGNWAAANLGNAGFMVGAIATPRYFNGYIDEVRLVKGTAVYTGNFTPQTAPFPDPAPPASLLLHFDGANGSTTITDSSGNAFTGTANGDTQISTAESKFGGASGYFDGSGDTVSFADDAKFNFGTGDFTVEMWLRFSSLPGDFAGIVQSNSSISSGGGNGGNAWFLIYHASLGLQFGQHGGSVASSSWSPSTNTWYHVAATRASGVLKLFVDGSLLLTSSSGVATATLGSDGILIGGIATPRYFNGYIDELRIVKGAAVYTAPFTPPSAPFPDPAPPASSLLLHFDGANGSTSFTDSSPNSFTVTANGNAQISTAVSKFGGASGHFGATSSGYLSVPDSPSLNFGTGDFTVEYWIFVESNGSNFFSPVVKNGNDDWAAGYGWEYSGTATIFVCAGVAATGGPVPTGQWVHVAGVRKDGVITSYVDGVAIASETASGYVNNSYDLTIGNRYISPQGGWVRQLNGYIDELRIIKGTAVYTASFTPPTAPF